METAQSQTLELKNTSNIGTIGVQSVDNKPYQKEFFEQSVFDTFRTSNTINSIFPGVQEENRIAKARRVMGEDIKDLTDEEVEVYLTEFNFLLDSWFDEFETKIFEGKTLQQMLREG